MGKPPPATDIRDVQVIKHDRAFFMSDRFGDVPEENQAALGLYYRDTRFLSKLELTLGELRPILLHSSTERNYSQIVELAFPPSWPTLRDSITGRTSRSPGTGCWRTRSWSRSRFGTSARSSNVQLSRFLDRAILDLRMLMSEDDSAPYLDAGVPWFSGLFGRDSLLAAYECLGVNPELAWGVLRGLAARQGTEENEWRDEEPGKILHELRVGELAGAGDIPHTPYYGSIDSTPLWLVLLTYAYSWTSNLDAVQALWPNAVAALEWIDRYGDLDGDGYVEYRKRSVHGLDNQGWKDSWNAVVHPDGTLAQGPIALVEVQGYVYQAKYRMVRLARAVGQYELADQLEREAAKLRDRFNRDFWMEKEGYYALALDGLKQQVRTITSNPGHCLWSGIVDEDKAPRVVRRLLSPPLSSGWGVRTLGARQQPFDPLGYHTGTVWPHDNALIAHGMKLYGFDAEAMKVIDQLSMGGYSSPWPATRSSSAASPETTSPCPSSTRWRAGPRPGRAVPLC